MGLILFILIVILLYLLLKPLILRYSYRYFTRKLENIFNGAYQNSSGNEQEHHTHEQPVNKKKIDKDVGEYVSFEEISVTASSYRETTADGSVETTVMEQQTIDVEWEDI